MKKLTSLLAMTMLAVTLLSAQKIVLTGLGADMIPELKTIAPGATFVAATSDDVVQKVADADAIIGTFSEDIFRAGKKLKWVHTYSAGVDPYRYPDFLKSDITLTNSKIVQGPEIADHAFALLLTLPSPTARSCRDRKSPITPSRCCWPWGLTGAIANRPNEEWGREGYKAIELRGKTAVIVGLGGIGTQIAERAHAFGMTVIGVDPKEIPLMSAVSKVVPPDRLDTVVPLADVLFLAVPHTPESENMIGEKQFQSMKKDSYFIAVSRGKIYSQPALIKALDERRLAGAGLDVTVPEPLPKGNALWKFENVIITPHIATLSDGILARRQELVRDNVGRFVKGEPLRNVVGKVRGY